MELRRSDNQQCICHNLHYAHTFQQRLLGLLGTAKLSINSGLWLKPCHQIHTFFMRYSIDIIFLDTDFRVAALHDHVNPWRVVNGPGTTVSTIELAAGQLETCGVAPGDYLELHPVTISATTLRQNHA